MRSSISRAETGVPMLGRDIDVGEVADRTGSCAGDRHPRDRVQPHRADESVIGTGDPSPPILRSERRPREACEPLDVGLERFGVVAVLLRVQLPAETRQFGNVIDRGRTDLRPGFAHVPAKAVSTASAHLAPAPEAELRIHDDLHDVEAAGAGRPVQRRQQVRRSFDPLVAGAGGPAQCADVDGVRRDEQLAVLGKVSLRQEREDLTTAVVHHDDRELEDPRRVPEHRADVVEEREVAEQRHRRPAVGGRDAERGRHESVDPAGAAVGQHSEAVARSHREIEVANGRRVADEQEPLLGRPRRRRLGPRGVRTARPSRPSCRPSRAERHDRRRATLPATRRERGRCARATTPRSRPGCARR